MLLLKIVFWSAIALVFYTYFGYGILLYIIVGVKRLLSKGKKISFFKLFPVYTKEYVVATFLAVLEMVKNKEIIITQNDTFDDIVCEVRS